MVRLQGKHSRVKSVIIYGVLLFTWMFVIFYFSSADSVSSARSSSEFTHSMLHILTRIGIIDACSITQTGFELTHQVFRGTAHLFEFAVLGVLSYLFFNEIFGSRAFRSGVVSFVFCLLYAISDEIHQYFVPGRSADLNDILIDAAGAGLGIVLTWTILRYLRRRKNMDAAEKL